ncbi:MAG: hypothetical protein IKB98_01040 [Clostridia bacterium]|nr:hypothetical protein [Clostridia bacterium]
MLSLIKKGLSGNTLKIIALITMTIDHVGAILFPNVWFLRIIGRISFPIFAFAIAEGCYYTKNKTKHFLLVFILAIICQVVYFINDRSLYMGILVIFSFSIALIYAFNNAVNSKKALWWCIFGVGVLLTVFIMHFLPIIFPNSGLYFDYGAPGAMLPVFIYAFKGKRQKIFITALALIPVCAINWTIQWWSYLALIPLCLYNGTRGKLNIKYLFYLYYPLHLLVLYGISYLI